MNRASTPAQGMGMNVTRESAGSTKMPKCLATASRKNYDSGSYVRFMDDGGRARTGACPAHGLNRDLRNAGIGGRFRLGKGAYP